MKLLGFIVLLVLLAGCSGRQEKDKNKDLDRPKPAVIR